MPTLREVVKNTLEADVILTGILPGGIFDASELPQDGGGASSAPRQSDGVRINPYAIIRWGNSAGYPPHKVYAEQGSVEIYFYQDTGYAIIEQAISRVKALLNDVYLEASDRVLAHVSFAFNSREVPADELGGAPCQFSRYSIIHVRD